MHIPESNFKYIRFYGAYHNSTKLNIKMFHLIDNNRITFRKTLNKWRNKNFNKFSY